MERENSMKLPDDYYYMVVDLKFDVAEVGYRDIDVEEYTREFSKALKRITGQEIALIEKWQEYSYREHRKSIADVLGEEMEIAIWQTAHDSIDLDDPRWSE